MILSSLRFIHNIPTYLYALSISFCALKIFDSFSEISIIGGDVGSTPERTHRLIANKKYCSALLLSFSWFQLSFFDLIFEIEPQTFALVGCIGRHIVESSLMPDL